MRGNATSAGATYAAHPSRVLGLCERLTRVSGRVGSSKSAALFSRVYRPRAVYSDAEGSAGRAMLGMSRDPPQAALISILEAHEIALEPKMTDCETNFGRPGEQPSRTYAPEMHGCGLKLECKAKYIRRLALGKNI